MNKRLSALAAAIVAVSSAALANDNIFVPPSSLERGIDYGRFAHTNHQVYTGPWYRGIPAVDLGGDSSHGPLFRLFANAPTGYYPDDIRSAYGVTGNGSGAIAIIDAFHYGTALNDFNVFATQFGLPAEKSTNATLATNKVFQVVYAGNMVPPPQPSWNQEAALDIEWAHAMAPNAKIYLVEALNNSDQALFQAVSKAASLQGVTQISMSWGGSEFNTEYLYDRQLTSTSATYFASSGDVGGAQEYPAESPKVVGVGGTTLNINTNLTYKSETGWDGSGGGPSAFEARPSFQNSLSSLLANHRGCPDISAVADPNTGVAVYDSTPSYGYVGWLVFGGTSVASPVCAGIANAAGGKRGSNELSYLYAHTSGFHDVTSNTPTQFPPPYSAQPGWDFVTGWGTPISQSAL